MVDVDRRMTGLNPAHLAGLRRLSARAATASLPPTTPHSSRLSLSSLSSNLITHLHTSNIRVDPALSETDLSLVEAQFGFTFPPDLKSLLRAGLPVGPGFPNWRSTRAHLQAQIDLPIAAISLQIAKNTLWSKSWGPRPDDPEKALKLARGALKRAPLLIPVFNHCYIPCNPCLAGNPVFFVDENRIFCCGVDLSDFFLRRDLFFSSGRILPPDPDALLRKQRSVSGLSSSTSSSSSSSTFSRRRSVDSSSGGRTPRWVEFWTDASVDRRKRNSSSTNYSSAASSPDNNNSQSMSRCLSRVQEDQHVTVLPLRARTMDNSSFQNISRSDSEVCGDPNVAALSLSTSKLQVPRWVEEYIDQMGSVLREGGWAESDVSEMTHVSASGFLDCSETVILDNQSVLDALLLKADRLSDSLRKAGWSSEEVTDALGFDFRVPVKAKKPLKKLSPELMRRIGKLAESVSQSSPKISISYHNL